MSAPTLDFSLAGAARMSGLSPHSIEAILEARLLSPRRDSAGQPRFSFAEIRFLRGAVDAFGQEITPAVLRRRARHLPAGAGGEGVQLASGRRGRSVALEGDQAWEPETGQCCFRFPKGEADNVWALPGAVGSLRIPPPEPAAEDWFVVGCRLEGEDGDEAREAYRHALELAPQHLEARINTLRLHLEAGRVEVAVAHAEVLGTLHPDAPHAALWAGRAFAAASRLDDAIAAWQRAIQGAPLMGDAYRALWDLFEREGRGSEADALRATWRQVEAGRTDAGSAERDAD